MEVHISVRNLVEFVLRSGSIDNRRFTITEVAMQEGSRIHRLIQRRMGSDYHAEVSVNFKYETEDFIINIDGRIDGVIETKKAEGLSITIDEIKGTYRDVFKIKEAFPIHMAQAMCYAYIYASRHNLPHICIRITYCNIKSEELKYFHQDYQYNELHSWFENLIGEYRKWAEFEHSWRKKRSESIKNISFPFEYRDGQKELITYVYQTIYHRRKLYIEAPTGVGKTISTLFPAIKAMGEGMAEKIFYLTAKTITRKVAEEAFEHLRDYNLEFKTVILTAKDKICFMSETDCNPLSCPYADGHYDRINDAVYALLTESDNFTRARISQYAEQFMVCPFELSLEMSLFADAVIGDYNYLFDPKASLKRFFAEGSRDFIFLIDEAHNLVERSREMYSALLRKEDFLLLRRLIKEYAPDIARCLGSCNHELLVIKRETMNYLVEPYLDSLCQSLSCLLQAMEKYLEDNENSPFKKELLLFYFEVFHFLDIKENLDDNYVVYAMLNDDESFIIKLFCVNPSDKLREYMQRGRSSILFSATFFPVGYYKKLLGAAEGDYDVYAKSVFNPNKRAVFIAHDVTSMYSRRNDTEYYNIACYLHEITKNRYGNYMVFFPSYQFLREVYKRFYEYFYDEQNFDLLLQEGHMDEGMRESFLRCFFENTKSIIGFCVSGGIFSEGIDLKNEHLIGAIIVGTSLPQVCAEREILKHYFDGQGENGFDYAYRLPGINKVLQAAGRVIRTQDDIGIVALLDERFLKQQYRRFFPPEWDNIEAVTISQIAGRVEKFWNDWL